jgi:hypothetical protein
VASDIEATTQAFSKNLGVTFVRDSGHSHASDVLFRGMPHSSSVLLAFADLNGTELEVIQPVSKGNIYTEFLDAKGPGLHHAGFQIPTIDQYRAYYDLLLENGNVPLLKGRIEEKFRVEFCYFDCTAFGAPFIEITHFF